MRGLWFVVLLGLFYLGNPTIACSNAIIEFMQIMALLNTAATKCSDFTKGGKEDLMKNIDDSVGLMSRLSGSNNVVNIGQMVRMVDQMYAYCYKYPDRLLLESVKSLFGSDIGGGGGIGQWMNNNLHNNPGVAGSYSGIPTRGSSSWNRGPVSPSGPVARGDIPSRKKQEEPKSVMIIN